jgi:hypothetical protein
MEADCILGRLREAQVDQVKGSQWSKRQGSLEWDNEQGREAMGRDG